MAARGFADYDWATFLDPDYYERKAAAADAEIERDRTALRALIAQIDADLMDILFETPVETMTRH